MSEELAFEPNLLFEIRNLRSRVKEIERSQRNYIVQTAPVIALHGSPRADGFYSHSSTSFQNVFRGDQACTAPSLGYDLFFSTTGGSIGSVNPTTPPTSIDWRIRAYKYSDASYVTLASANETGATGQRAGFIDLFTLLGEDVYNQLIRIDIDTLQTGGTAGASSDIIGVRLNTPFLFRVKAV